MLYCLIIVVLVSLTECYSTQLSSDFYNEYPLAESLRYKNKQAKTLEEAQANRDFLQKYHMRRISQESFDNVERERRHRKVDVDELDLLKEDELNRRHRRPAKPESAVGRRRARSQEIRREKLHSQGLRSHMQHSKHTSHEYYNDFSH